jgi:hypothetical protein
VFLPIAHDPTSGTSTNSVNAHYFPTSDFIGEIRPASRYPYTFPYFLYPPSRKIPLTLASHRPALDAHGLNRTLHSHHHRTNRYEEDAHEESGGRHGMRMVHNDSASSFSHMPTANLTNGWMHLQRELRKQFYDVGEDDFYGFFFGW